jgi:probable F420-dependent oxidoreductase
MRIDTHLGEDPTDATAAAQRAEEAGYDAIWTSEAAHDPFLPLVLAADHTERLNVGTAIVVAFGRSPLTLATTAWDLNCLSRGRLLLGLGSQVKPHIEKRYSMPWSRPAARMREYVEALLAIWDCWQNGSKLEFRGDFYTHTLMTPRFSPPSNPWGRPKVYVAAVNELMTQAAADVGDGLIAHAFTTERFLRNVTLPTVAAGLAKRGLRRSDFELSLNPFVVTGANDDEIRRSDAATRSHIAFYASTPAYRGVLELHGWGELQTELTVLSKRGEWDEMGRRITDDMLETFAVKGSPAEVAIQLQDRFGDLVDRICLLMPGTDRAVTEQVLEALGATSR